AAVEWTWGWMKRLPPASHSPRIAIAVLLSCCSTVEYKVKNAHRVHWQGREEPGAGAFVSLLF
uniref:Uncharacterized protein n=1 Tax=Chlorocebus sabaeus TaxID=60711 RepID=A0A0D9RWH3_CHLSB